MYTFYSKLTETKTYGQTTKTVPVMASVLMGVKPGTNGWFGAQVNAKRETVLKIAQRLAPKCPDLVVEGPDGQQVAL